MEHIVFYFSGTGNSLKAAKALSEKLGNCKIVSMAKPFNVIQEYESVGFVYPVYFWGLPKRVIEFVKEIKLNNNKNTYYYAIATYGGSAGNAVYQLYKLLFDKHGIKLNYGKEIQMFSNYVILYDMSADVNGITKKSNEKLVPVIDAIKRKEHNKISKVTHILRLINKDFIKKVSTKDKHYSVNNDCTGCGICAKVCPVKNIEMEHKKPRYKHHCEQCVACIQFCPQKAINYKNATQNRRRYTHPEITYTELYDYNTGNA